MRNNCTYSRIDCSRRSALKRIALLSTIAAFQPSIASAQEKKAAAKITDEDIFNFALNLESLETEYYLRGTTGKGMDDADAGSNPGAVTGGKMVPWQDDDLRQFMEEVAANELAHVRFYRKTLGKQAVSRPAIDLTGFTAAAKAAGLGDNFDPFASEMNFFLGGMLMEDVGVTAYHGAAPLISNKKFLDAAAGILAVEAYHMGMARSVLYRMGPEAREAANALSDARDKLDGSEDLDQGIVLDGKANIVPSSADGIAFSRTPQQVLRIVYLADNAGVSSGGLFPNGMNGTIKTT
ncbi:MAG TPA: ferritin-like domain-containing protein [Candidatus Udaeobacter sp.]|nr:ferritin-like domain-containing protein [Candidatus Udaeobacter sp.]